MPSGSPPSADVAVTVEDLVIRYGNITAVDRASFSAARGEVTVILGPNGAGKTSTVEHLEGYRKAHSGRSSVLGLDPVRDHSRLTSRVGIMLQNGGIPMSIRPLDVLRQYAGFFDDPLDPSDLLERVGLSSHTRSTYRKLSGGEKQRLSLALAIIGRPEVVFLDEPSAGVDLAGRDSISEIIRGLRESDVCVVVTTHDLSEAERLADRVVIIDRGRVVTEGPLEELLSGGSTEEVFFSTVGGRLDTSLISAHVNGPVTEVEPGEYRVPAPGNKTELMAAVATWCAAEGIELLDLRAGRLRLDDVFRRLTQGTAVGVSHESGPDPTSRITSGPSTEGDQA